MMAANFDFDDFIKQYKSVTSMGGMVNVIKMMPGMAGVSEKQIYAMEKQYKVFESIIQSMTKEERSNPDLLVKSPSRRRRIARGSGRSDDDVNNLLGIFTAMRQQMQSMSRLMALGSPGEWQ